MSIAALMKQMRELGAPMEAIEVAVAAVEAEQEKDADRRAKRAAQKRKERSGSDSRATVARQGSDKGATVAATPQMSPTPPKNTPGYSDPSVPSGSASSDAAEPVNFDPRSELRKAGCEKLQRMTGRPRDGCQALIGKWLREANDDALTVLNLIHEAEHQEAVHPVSFIAGRLKGADTGPKNGGAARPPPAHNRGNGLNHLAERKAQGDASVYADPYAAYDQPSPHRNGRAHHDGGADADFGFDQGDPEGRRGQLLDFGRARTGAG